MPANRLNVSSGSPFEPKIGFSRAVRIGTIVSVSGTAPIAHGGATACVGDAAGQTRRCLEIIGEALAKAGASMQDVIRTRTYLTRIADWEAVGAVQGEVFRDIRPASTMVEVSRFINPEWLVEIEADAVLPESEAHDAPPGETVP